MMCFHKRLVAKSATVVKTIFEFFLIKVKRKMSKLAIFFLARIFIFKFYFISIPGNDDKNLLTDFYINKKRLILSTATKDYSIPSSYAKNLLRLNI